MNNINEIGQDLKKNPRFARDFLTNIIRTQNVRRV